MNQFFCFSKKRASKIQMSHEKTLYYFRLNPGCLIVLRIMVDLNPHITRQLFIPYKSPNNNCLGPFFHFSNGWVLATRTKISMEKYLKHRLLRRFDAWPDIFSPARFEDFKKKITGLKSWGFFQGFFSKIVYLWKNTVGKTKTYGRDFEAITGFFSLFKVFLFLSTMMNQHETTI